MGGAPHLSESWDPPRRYRSNELLAGEQVTKLLSEEVQMLGNTVQIAPGEPEAYQEGSMSVGGWLARPSPCPMGSKSFLGGALSFTRKTVSGRWYNAMPPSV